MSFQILDFVLFGIMIVSGLFALARGLTREILSLFTWGLAFAAAYFAQLQQPLVDLVLPHVSKPILAQIAVAGTAFLLILIIGSVVSVKFSDFIVDSRVGAFDRTLGFFFGLLRGLVLVSIAYLFYSFLVPIERHEDWIKSAVTLPVVRTVSNTLRSFMPPDIAEVLGNATIISNPGTQVVKPTDTAAATEGQPGYSTGVTKGLDNLVQGTEAAPAQEPAFGQGATQQ